MMGTLIHSEWVKLKKAKVMSLVWISPILASIAGYFTFFDFGINQWMDSFTQMVLIQAPLFLPLLTAIFSAAICRYEHEAGGWRQLFSLPISRVQLFLAKYVIVILLIAVSQLLFIIGLLSVGFISGYSDPIPWQLILPGVAMAWVACLPLAALQLWVSTAWASFAAPVALNVVFTLPTIAVANSATYGPWYPWAQPFLAMIGAGDNGDFVFSYQTLVFVILGSLVVFLIGGVSYIRNKAV